MEWQNYYDRFYDWEESTQLRHLSTLIDFGQVCELAKAFFEEKSANRLIIAMARKRRGERCKKRTE